ncbi:hypothetical protein AX774_g3482 [Zancudomyces culisetae]|uniref:Uncharacterized protein n=1 Tax=Zancudomyces culisetae TaxID=1213189 RepID=A0A1R1PPY1_ZANCU|nr:hypothetical protein AX774_g3482 [Zancudomyces culisetae]|eukprot:OMH83017.1 hypothetical protein AX774_g3482 [Zancudomyces culisetae]
MLASIKLDSDIIEKYINETLLDSSIPKSEKKEIIKEYLVEPKLEQVANEIIDRFSEGTLKITNNASNDGRAELLTTQTTPKYTRKGLSFSKRSNLERVFSYKGAPSANTNTGNDNPSGYFETPKSKRNNSLLQQGLGKYDDSQTHLSDSSRLAGAGCFGGGVNSVGYEGILKDHIYSEGFVDSTIGTHTEVSRHGVAGGNMLSGITEFGNIGGNNISSMGLAGNLCNDFGGMIGENSGSFAGGSSYPLYSPDNAATGNTYYGTDYRINNSTISGANIVEGEMFGNMGAVPVDEPDNVTYTDEEIIARVFSTIDEDVIWEAFLTNTTTSITHDRSSGQRGWYYKQHIYSKQQVHHQLQHPYSWFSGSSLANVSPNVFAK